MNTEEFRLKAQCTYVWVKIFKNIILLFGALIVGSSEMFADDSRELDGQRYIDLGKNVRTVISKNRQSEIHNNQKNTDGYRSNTIIPHDIYVSINGKSVPLYTLSAKQIDSIADSPELDIFKYERREIAQEPSQTSPERKTQSHKVPTNSGSQNKKAIQISEEVPWRDWSIGKEDINYLYYQYGTVGNVYYLMREGNNNNSNVCGSVRFVNAAKGAISLHANPQKLTSNVYIDHELIRPVWRGTWKDNHGKDYCNRNPQRKDR